MKYIKTYEIFHKTGDYIVLLKNTTEHESKLGFITGDVYKISYIDIIDKKAPYAIKKINDTFKENYIWINSYEMRDATTEEIENQKIKILGNKYNL